MNVREIVLTNDEMRTLKRIKRGAIRGADAIADGLCDMGLARPCLIAVGRKLSVYRITPDGERYLVYHSADAAERRLARFLSIAALLVSVVSLLISAVSLLRSIAQ